MRRKYTEKEKTDLIEKVLELLPETTTTLACKAAGLPHTTFLDWMMADKTLTDRYMYARSLYPEQLAKEIMEISEEEISLDDRGRTDTGKVQQNRLRIDSRKWLLSKMAPRKYGDRLALVGDEEQPVAIVKVERTVVDKRKEIEESG